MSKTIITSGEQVIDLVKAMHKSSFHTFYCKGEKVPSPQKYGTHIVRKEYVIQAQIGGDYYNCKKTKEKYGENNGHRNPRAGVDYEIIPDVILHYYNGNTTLNLINPRKIGKTIWYLDGEQVELEELLKVFAPSAIGYNPKPADSATFSVSIHNILAID